MIAIKEKDIKKLIESVFPNRSEEDLCGQHPDLALFKQWYNGKTDWHTYLVLNNRGEQVAKERKASCIAKLGCEAISNNYANENLVVSVPDKDNESIQNVLQKNKFIRKFNKFTERFNALSMASTLVMPSEIAIGKESKQVSASENAFVKIWMIKDAERIYPITNDDGEITECAFVRYATNKCYLQAHLLDENNEYVVVEVEGKPTKNGDYVFDFESIKKLNTKSRVPLFQIWTPNIEDNKNDNQVSTSVFANAIDEMKTIDLILTSFNTEFKNGAKKRFISGDLTWVDQDGNKVNTPLDEEDFYIQGDRMNGETMPMQEFNGELRVDAHIRALNFHLNMFSSKLGLGTDVFQYDSTSGRPLQTATAVVAKQTDLYRNVIKNENQATDNLKKMLIAIEYVNNTFTNNPQMTFKEKDIAVKYDDNILEDTTSKKQSDMSEVQNGIITKAEYRSRWMDETIEDATKFVQEHALDGEKYMTMLQMGAITPEKYCELVFGQIDNGVIEAMKKPTMPSFDESDDEEEVEEDEQTTDEQPREVQ